MPSRDNGGTPGPYAALVERIDEHDVRIDALDGRFGEALGEIGLLSDVVNKTYRAATTAANEAAAARTELREEREARLRECSIRHCDAAPRGPLASVDYDTLSDTGLFRRAEELEAKNAALAARAAALEATLAERDRQSDRARALVADAERRADAVDDRRWTKAQKIGAAVLALLTAGGGGAVLVEVIARVLGAR